MPAGDVGDQGAERGDVGRRVRIGAAEALRRRKPSGEQTHRGAFDIAFHARDLAGETQARLAFSRS